MSNKSNSEHPTFEAQEDPRKNDLYYDLAKSKENWRRACFIVLFYSLLVTGALIFRSFQAEFKPYAVTFNEVGKPIHFGPAEPLTQSDERLLRAELYEWISTVRTIYESRDLLNNQMNDAFALVSSNVSEQLNQYFSIPENDPRNLIDRWRRTVDVRSIIPIDNQQGRWKIEWIETKLSKEGEPRERQAWEAFLTVKKQVPTTSEGITKNPLGIYITELNWSPISPSTQKQ